MKNLVVLTLVIVVFVRCSGPGNLQGKEKGKTDLAGDVDSNALVYVGVTQSRLMPYNIDTLIVDTMILKNNDIDSIFFYGKRLNYSLPDDSRLFSRFAFSFSREKSNKYTLDLKDDEASMLVKFDLSKNDSLIYELRRNRLDFDSEVHVFKGGRLIR